MWLINTRTRKLKEFISEDDIPLYAALSHTWGEDEVSFQQWMAMPPESQHTEAYSKIIHSCEQAQLDGIDWIWIDT